ncbi:MAG: DUF2318 domain-containing protein [Spirochaetales bacterium]|nr:DUF2318 domain-containing protein [Spirochaetales bacterium]
MNTSTRITSGFPARFLRTALTGVLIFFASGSIALWGQPPNPVPLSSADGRLVVIPQKDIGLDARFFTYKTKSNALVGFFAILDRGKGVHVAFDACDVCYQARKGYRIVNGFAVCNNCGQSFPLTSIGKDNLTGGCWPSYLPISVKRGLVEIKTADLDKKAYLFPGTR